MYRVRPHLIQKKISCSLFEKYSTVLLSYSTHINVMWYIYRINISTSTFIMYGVRNLDMSIRFSLKSRPSERFPRPEMSQIKAEISLRTNLKLICHKNVGLQ